MLVTNTERAPLHAKSPHIVGLAPRSIYSEATEADAWLIAAHAHAGCIRAMPVIANRKIIGIIQGEGVFSAWVRYIKFPKRYRFSWVDMRRRIADLEAMPFPDGNTIMDSLTNGKNGFVYYAKTPSTTDVANTWLDMFPVAGVPAAGSIAGTAFTANNFTDASTGAMNHRGNVSTDTKHFLAIAAVASANTPWVTVYDRVLSYDQCTYNAAANQALTNTNVAARYNSGAPGSLCFICVNTVNGATAANLTQFRYTNQAGTTLQAMPTTQTVTFIPSGAAPTSTRGARVIIPSVSGQVVTLGPWVPLASGDSGMSLVHDYTTSAANTGTFSIVLAYPMVGIILPVATVPCERDTVYQMSELERIYDGACLSLLNLQPATTANLVTGRLRFAWHS